MQWTLILAALIVVLLGALAVIGWRLPAEHRTTREAELPRSVDAVWSAISDFRSLPTWMPGVRRVQRLDPVDGKERWLYDTTEGELTVEVVARIPPTALKIRSVSAELPFGGSWTQTISPTADGCLVTVRESGWIANPLFRFMFRYVFGLASTPDAALVALGRHLGVVVTPREAREQPRPTARETAGAI